MNGQAEETTDMTEAEFISHAGRKKELYEFLETQNIILPN